MESLQHVLTRCLGELREWRAEQPEAAQHAEEVYARVERSLRQLRRIQDADEAARMVAELELWIRDEGPLEDEFLPSLEDLHGLVKGVPPS